VDGPTLPWIPGDLPVIIRTDFDDEPAWRALRNALVLLDPGDPRRLDAVDDRTFAGLTAERFLELAGPDWSDLHGVLYLVDRTTLSEPGMPLLVLGLLDEERGRSFRATAASVSGIDANLQIGNLSFTEFAEWAGDGVLDTG
jgi:hypothetical protein